MLLSARRSTEQSAGLKSSKLIVTEFKQWLQAFGFVGLVWTALGPVLVSTLCVLRRL